MDSKNTCTAKRLVRGMILELYGLGYTIDPYDFRINMSGVKFIVTHVDGDAVECYNTERNTTTKATLSNGFLVVDGYRRQYTYKFNHVGWDAVMVCGNTKG